MPFSLGAQSLAKLQGVHPDLVRVVKRAIELTPVDFRVICGLRTKEEQAILVKTGKSLTMKSRHLTGHAVDIVPLPVNWNKAQPFRDVAKAMKDAAKECGVTLEWGGDWSKLIDMPHFQLSAKAYPA